MISEMLALARDMNIPFSLIAYKTGVSVNSVYEWETGLYQPRKKEMVKQILKELLVRRKSEIDEAWDDLAKQWG